MARDETHAIVDVIATEVESSLFFMQYDTFYYKESHSECTNKIFNTQSSERHNKK